MINQERIQQWLEEVCGYLDIDVPKLVLTDDKQGQALRTRTSAGVEISISLPKAILTHSEALAKYYVIHECVHHFLDSAKHDKAFKAEESKTLGETYGIGIKYNRAYPKYLYDLNDKKQILWGVSDSILGKGLCLIKKIFL